MRIRSVASLLLFALVSSCASDLAAADTPLTTVRIASGLSRPLFLTAPPGDTERLFVIEQFSGTTGRIRIIKNGALLATPFLSISPVSTGNEQGLLGLAFDPNYATTGRFYVDYTDSGGTTRIARGTVSANPDVANATLTTILSIAQPFANHNGGWLAFGPDGYLYIASGDGGSANDPGNRAQTITNMLLGKLLRIDVSGAAGYTIPPDNPFVGIVGDDEIWAYGLRNPWRCSFDRQTGELYIADVGQGAWEEVNVQPAGAGGRNYGWRCMEGLHCTGLTGCTCNGPELTLPVYEYGHTGGRCSITGGYVYRGCAIPDLRGTYFLADYCSGSLISFRYEGGVITGVTDRTAELVPDVGTINNVTSFGEDALGEMYIVDRSGGEVFKIVPGGPVLGDMNGDARVDRFDLPAFALALVDPAGYAAAYPALDPVARGDVSTDALLDGADVGGFTQLLLSSPGYCY